jgi:transposase
MMAMEGWWHMGRWSRRDEARLLDVLAEVEKPRMQLRVLAVLRVVQGYPVAETAEFLGVGASSVERWVKRYRQSHDPQVLADAPRSGRPQSLDADALWHVERWLRHSPQELGYPAVNWTVPLLLEQLRRCGLAACSDETLRRRLHEGNWAWKRPRYVLDRDPESCEKRAAFSPGSCV